MPLPIDLTGKRALITGAGNGIGRGCALALARAGAELVLNDLSSQRKALQATARDAGGSPQLIEIDTFKERRRESLVAAAGSVDVFISCPYRSIRKPFLELTLQDWKSVLDATLTSHARLASLVAARMVAAKRPGSIIFIGSIYGLITRIGSGAYDASKAGLHQLTRSMAMEFAPHRIRVNAIAPGYTDTPGERRFASEVEIQRAARALPMGELCQPADIGHTAAFLVSDLARMTSGQVLVVDGLMSLCDFSYGLKLCEEQ